MAQFSNCPEPTATAALFSHEAVLRVLMEKGKPVVLNSPTSHTQWTPLMFAASIGSKPACELLIDRGADPDRINCLDSTALEIAMACGSSEVRAYLQGKTSVSSRMLSNLGQSTEDYFDAVRDGDMERVQDFLANDLVDIDALDGIGASALMMAAICGHGDVVELLLGLGADVDLQDFVNGWTALMQATFYGQKHIAKTLLKAGADPTSCANNGCTALDLATLVEETDTELLRLLAGQTIEACPPSLSFIPAKKQAFGGGGATRSLSMMALNDQQAMAAADGKGFKAWLGKLSGRFRKLNKDNNNGNNNGNNKVAAGNNRISAASNPPKRDHLVVDNIETRVDASIDLDRSVFTLGFAAATTDLSSYLVSPMCPPSFQTEQADRHGGRRQQHKKQQQQQQFIIPDGFNKIQHHQQLGRGVGGGGRSSAAAAAKVRGSKAAFHSSANDADQRANKNNNGRRRGSSSRGHSRTQSNQSDPGPRPQQQSSDRGGKPKDVKAVLKRLNLTKYWDVFESEEIDLKAFKELTEEGLKELGIVQREARNAILKEITKL